MKRDDNVDGTKERPLLAKISTALQKIKYFAGTPWARWFVLGLFVVQAVILVFTVRIGTPPDETNHIQFIQYYAHHSLSPVFSQQQPTLNLGDKTREPDYLYHYVMSLLVRILPFTDSVEITIIRLFSVLFGLLSMLTLAKAFKLLGVSAAAITVGLLIATNLPMVLMMSAAVNNDTPVWLGMALGLWLLVRLWRKPSAADLLWLFALSILGGLVKRTLLPLGFVFGVLGLIILARNWRIIIAGIKRFNWQICVALILIVVGAGLFTQRIGGNLMRYHTVAPSCNQVDGAQACKVFWGNIRDAQLAKEPVPKPISPPTFVVRWFSDSFSNVVDIQTQGWRHEVKPARWLTPVLVFLLIVGVVYGFIYDKRKFAASGESRLRIYIMLVALFFVGVHLMVNYGEYKHYKVFGIALNGRYIIPSLLPLIIFAGFYWSKLLARYPQLVVLLAVVIALSTIFGSGLLMMFRNPQLIHG